jgi:hypothetical protein
LIPIHIQGIVWGVPFSEKEKGPEAIHNNLFSYW